MTLVERYLMTLSYADVFESILRENEEDDLAVNQRIREHSWVTTKHLELDIDEENPSVRRAMDLAITGESWSAFTFTPVFSSLFRTLCRDLPGKNVVMRRKLLPYVTKAPLPSRAADWNKLCTMHQQ